MAGTKTLVSRVKQILTRNFLSRSSLLASIGGVTNIGRKTLPNFERIDFDVDYYLQKYPDIQASKIDPYLHFVRYGYLEGRSARFFDSLWYAQKYTKSIGANIGPAEHFRTLGKQMGLNARFVVVKTEHVTDQRNDYLRWIRAYEPRPLPRLTAMPTLKISILMAVFNPDKAHLISAIESVLSQTYGNWELCIADDASTNPEIAPLLSDFAARENRIKVIIREQNGHISKASNTALTLASGEYIGLLDHDDILESEALSLVAALIDAHPDADIVYSDEDKLDFQGDRYDPYFKPDFNYELFLAQNMINHFGVYKTQIVRDLGGFREGVEGAQDYDLAFRVLERSEFQRIYHIPRILYHWRASKGSTALSLDEKSYTVTAGLNVLQSHLERIGARATVTVTDERLGHYRVKYELTDPNSKVSIIIPTRDRADILRVCIESVLNRTKYKSYEIIVVDNGSAEPETKTYLAQVSSAGVKVISADLPFNFSNLNNIGAAHASGEYLCLLNNDVEVLTEDWLTEMISFAQQPEVGCVGARLWYPDKTLQHGGIILGIGGVAGHAHKRLDDSSTGYFGRAVHHQTYSAVTAACLVVSKSKYNEVGGLNERLAVAFNDVDFCLRIRAAGYRNVWTPYAELIHHESASRGEEVTIEKQKRFNAEIEYMLSHWQEIISKDPAYNPNLTLLHEDYSLSWPPRDPATSLFSPKAVLRNDAVG